jgi:hypothetical protein
MGEAGHIRSANNKNLHGFFLIFYPSPVSGVKIAVPIVLAQHKGRKRIDEAQR